MKSTLQRLDYLLYSRPNILCFNTLVCRKLHAIDFKFILDTGLAAVLQSDMLAAFLHEKRTNRCILAQYARLTV
jgi:hypothetical protein